MRHAAARQDFALYINPSFDLIARSINHFADGLLSRFFPKGEALCCRCLADFGKELFVLSAFVVKVHTQLLNFGEFFVLAQVPVCGFGGNPAARSAIEES